MKAQRERTEKGTFKLAIPPYHCFKCGEELNSNNWAKGNEKHRIFVCRECHNTRTRLEDRELKRLVLNNYSENNLRCSCCGETELEFLTINHINGGGVYHRKQLGGGNFYRWLKRNNYPEGYNVLCSNCNSSLGYYGYCPHRLRG